MLYSKFLVVIRRLALLIKPTGLHMLSVRKLGFIIGSKLMYLEPSETYYNILLLHIISYFMLF